MQWSRTAPGVVIAGAFSAALELQTRSFASAGLELETVLFPYRRGFSLILPTPGQRTGDVRLHRTNRGLRSGCFPVKRERRASPTVNRHRNDIRVVVESNCGSVPPGRRNGNVQRLDAFALNSLPHTGMKRVCYEVKASRRIWVEERTAMTV